MTDKRYILPVQMKSAMKPAQHSGRFRSERRIFFWRGMFAVVFIFFACLFTLLYLGAFDGFAGR